MKKQKKLPKFKTEEAWAKFWDTHSPLDYPGEFTEVENPFKFSRALAKKNPQRRKLRVAYRQAEKDMQRKKSITEWKNTFQGLSKKDPFQKLLKESRKWAREVGLKKSDIVEAIKKVREERRRVLEKKNSPP